MEKYEEILKCKDEHIKDLETKVRDLQKCVENVQNSEASGYATELRRIYQLFCNVICFYKLFCFCCRNLQQLLTRRLQGVAYFLDKLLSHK